MRYTIKRIRSYFTRVGYAVQLYNDDGSLYIPWLRVEHTNHYMPWEHPMLFYGDDGRTVRAEAIAFAKSYIKELGDDVPD